MAGGLTVSALFATIALPCHLLRCSSTSCHLTSRYHDLHNDAQNAIRNDVHAAIRNNIHAAIRNDVHAAKRNGYSIIISADNHAAEMRSALWY